MVEITQLSSNNEFQTNEVSIIHQNNNNNNNNNTDLASLEEIKQFFKDNDQKSGKKSFLITNVFMKVLNGLNYLMIYLFVLMIFGLFRIRLLVINVFKLNSLLILYWIELQIFILVGAIKLIEISLKIIGNRWGLEFINDVDSKDENNDTFSIFSIGVLNGLFWSNKSFELNQKDLKRSIIRNDKLFETDSLKDYVRNEFNFFDKDSNKEIVNNNNEEENLEEFKINEVIENSSEIEDDNVNEKIQFFKKFPKRQPSLVDDNNSDNYNPVVKKSRVDRLMRRNKKKNTNNESNSSKINHWHSSKHGKNKQNSNEEDEEYEEDEEEDEELLKTVIHHPIVSAFTPLANDIKLKTFDK